MDKDSLKIQIEQLKNQKTILGRIRGLLRGASFSGKDTMDLFISFQYLADLEMHLDNALKSLKSGEAVVPAEEVKVEEKSEEKPAETK